MKIDSVDSLGKSFNKDNTFSFCLSSIKSVLLNTTIKCFPSQRGIIFSDNCSIWEAAFTASTIQRTISAWSNFWKVRSIPKLSIVSLVSRIPAVSMNRKVIPPILTVSSITSRVVPWISLTMALSSFNNTFSKVDFPAFVSPMIATGTPFLMALPTLNEWANREMTCSISSASFLNAERSANSTSSSLKSNSNSIMEVKFNNLLRRSVTLSFFCFP